MTDPTQMSDSELREAVAREVMGWTFDERLGFVGDGEPQDDEAWQPLTDLNAAFAVAEKLSCDWWFRIHSPFVKGNTGFAPHGITGWNGRMDYEAGDDNLCRAICLFALAAARAEKERAK